MKAIDDLQLNSTLHRGASQRDSNILLDYLDTLHLNLSTIFLIKMTDGDMEKRNSPYFYYNYFHYYFYLYHYLMPYLYPVEIRQSMIDGKGVFATVNIPKGVICWVYHCENPLPVKGITVLENRAFTKEELEAIKDPAQLNRIFHGGMYMEDYDRFLDFRDGSHYMNHSPDANSRVLFSESKDYRDLKGYTLRQIKAGDEITEIYTCYPSQNSEWVEELMEKYSQRRIGFEKQLSNETLKEK